MKIRYWAFILPFLFCCCKKSQSGSSNNNAAKFSYTAQYDSVITWYANSVYNFSFNINVTSGDIDNNPLYCSVSGLPASVSVEPSSLRVTQILGGVFAFTIGNLPAGTDTMHFVISSTAYGSQSHDLILKIISPPDFAPRLAGAYDSSYDFCSPNIDNYASSVSTVTDTPGEIKISNIKGLGSSFIVTAWVSQVLTVPLQTISGYTIWGSGTYTLDNRPAYNTLYTLAINDTLVQGVDTQTCTTHIQH